MKTWMASGAVIFVLGAVAWLKPGAAIGVAQAQATQANRAVQIIPAGQKQVGSPGEKGATYYALEAQTTRLTTRFRDGHAAVTERGLVGDVRTTLRDVGGNDRAQLRMNRIDSGHDMVSYEPTDGTQFQALSDPAVVKPTLDWAARQVYGLVKDGADNLVWDGATMKRRSAPQRDVDADVDALETVWANGLTARLTRTTYSRRQISPGRFVEGPVMVSELTQYGAPVGTGVYFEKDRVFAYSVPGFTAGAVVIGADELKANYGGWPFTPDTTWLNLQMIATYHFKTLVAKQGSVGKACEPSRPSRLARFFSPTLYANEAGCDDLHWLDGSVLRDCCDDHDRCYAKSGCDSNTWWQWWRSWSCDRCNMTVVGCFFARASLDDRCITRQGCAG
jgi:hypothetical protein